MAVVAYAAEARSITGSLDGPAHDDAPAEPVHVIRQILESGRRETFVLGDLSRRGGLSSSTRGLPRPTLDSGVGTVKLEDEPGRRQIPSADEPTMRAGTSHNIANLLSIATHAAGLGSQRPSLSSTASYYTAEERNDTGRGSFASAATYHSVEDRAVVNHMLNIDDFRHEFRELDVTASIHNVSPHPSGFGGSADIRQADFDRYSRPGGYRRVALKVPRVASADTGVLQRFAREIGVWRTLFHRNVLPLYGLYWGDSFLPAIVSPWYKNGNINEYIAAMECSPSMNVLALKFQLLEDTLHGLSHLHAIKVVHGDLKGANILVADDGVARLADFGVSAVLSEHPPRSATTTGTYRWMAPELFRDGARLTWASDVWAYGCVVLEVMSGERPFAAVAEEAKVIITLYEKRTPPRPPRVPDALWQLSQTCFAMTPDDRPPAEAVLARLQETAVALEAFHVS